MKNTTSTKTIWIFIGLLVVAFGFWRWSLVYRANHAMEGEKMIIIPTSDEDLDKELDASINSNSEIELKGVDQEF